MTKRNYRILSLDGGGIRGLMTAIWLDRLESELGQPLHGYFDLIAGTSTGSILACAISAGMPASTIVDLYKHRGREVFSSFQWRLLSRAGRLFSDGISAPKYDGKGLETALRDVFKNLSFGQLRVSPTLVTSYNTLARQGLVFKNSKASHQGLLVWEVCRSSCAAPVYFPAHIMKLGQSEAPLIDGGVVANNPTACAIAEGIRVNAEKAEPDRVPLANFLVASFGTGQTTRPITPEDAREWGALEWAFPIIDVLFDGAADATDYIVSQLLGDDRYFRFQTELDRAYDDMDNADETNLNALAGTAEQYLDGKEGRTQLENLVKMLEAARTG